MLENSGNILIYQTEKGETKVDVFFNEDTIWMTQRSMCELYQVSKSSISEHIKNIYVDKELEPDSTVRKFRTVQSEGSRQVSRELDYYNLDMILAVGYRVRSTVGTHFRNWASSVLSEYMKKGFALNDERLKNPKKFGADYFDELLERIRDIRASENWASSVLSEYMKKGFALNDERLKNPKKFGADYFDELLERIRDIRASEKRVYLKVRDIFATSIDYDPKSEQADKFFKTVQNKLHYSVHGHTAPELIVERANSSKDNMGLTSFKGSKVRKSDVTIAKNYLNQEEIDNLNRIVTMYLDYAEDQARQHIPMYMNDWEQRLNIFLQFMGRKVLSTNGTISREEADKFAKEQYEIFNNHRKKMEEHEEIIDELPQLPKYP